VLAWTRYNMEDTIAEVVSLSITDRGQTCVTEVGQDIGSLIMHEQSLALDLC